MSDKIFKASLDTAAEELTKALVEKEELESQLDDTNYRIESLQEAVRGLAALCDMDYRIEFPNLFPQNQGSSPAEGLTDRVRRLFLKHSSDYFSAVDVRNKLREDGFPIERYSNALATIHTVLRRLHRGGDIFPQERDGKTYYTSSIPF